MKAQSEVVDASFVPLTPASSLPHDPQVTPLHDERTSAPTGGRNLARRWGNTAVAAGYLAAAAFCWVAGDRHHGYNGWLVAAGWVLGLTAWVTWANRDRPIRHPLKSMGSGVGFGLLMGAGFVLQIAGLAIGLAVLVGALSGAEWVLNHFH